MLVLAWFSTLPRPQGVLTLTATGFDDAFVTRTRDRSSPFCFRPDFVMRGAGALARAADGRREAPRSNPLIARAQLREHGARADAVTGRFPGTLDPYCLLSTSQISTRSPASGSSRTLSTGPVTQARIFGTGGDTRYDRFPGSKNGALRSEWVFFGRANVGSSGPFAIVINRFSRFIFGHRVSSRCGSPLKVRPWRLKG